MSFNRDVYLQLGDFQGYREDLLSNECVASPKYVIGLKQAEDHYASVERVVFGYEIRDLPWLKTKDNLTQEKWINGNTEIFQKKKKTRQATIERTREY